jgi:hypothetical protein
MKLVEKAANISEADDVGKLAAQEVVSMGGQIILDQIKPKV